ncbi:MAG TPA: TfoX/Sxy family protein [Kofleriaceae bacterium]|nr:TfoX/Sxy family protein [Kofleriaceae bacterium]
MGRDAGEELAGRVLEHLAGLARLAVGRVFGGVGLYSGRRLFGLVYRGTLYLRADDGMRRDLARRGAGPFRPYRGREVSAFWEVPEALAGEKRRVRALARRALAATDKLARGSLAAAPSLAQRVQRAALARARRVPPRRR